MIPFFAHTRDEEYLVVHGQAEENGKHHDRQEREDWARTSYSEEFVEPAPLEDRDGYARCCCKAQQTCYSRRQGNNYRTEQDYKCDKTQ